MSILVTGAAGFIAPTVAEELLARGDRVIGLDQPEQLLSRPEASIRLQRLERHQQLSFQRAAPWTDTAAISETVRSEGLKRGIPSAAQAGLRYSIENRWPIVNRHRGGPCLSS